MFSREDVEFFSINFAFPTKRKGILVEEFVEKIPLGTLKLKTAEVYTLLTRLTRRIPILTFSSLGINCALSGKRLTLELGRRPTPFEDSKEHRKLIAKSFLDDTLGKLDYDMNFMVGKISGFLSAEKRKMKSSGHIRLSKRIEDKISFNSSLKEEVLDAFKKTGEIHFNTVGIGLTKKEGISSIQIRSLKKRLIVEVGFGFSSDRPIRISGLITNTLNELNEHYRKFKVG